MDKNFIDIEKYKLGDKNYYYKSLPKYKIIFGNTLSSNMNHVIGWKNRFNGETKKTSTFTIDINGNIYQHFDPKYYSSFLGVDDIDKHVISILIENEGWLLKDEEKNVFIDYVGNIYNRSDEVKERKWRGQLYWAPYNLKQIESASKLVKVLCKEFSIPLKCIPHNTKIDMAPDYNGILYRSNFEKHLNDLSPAWDYNEFKNKIEL